jgi:hypothetical protein
MMNPPSFLAKISAPMTRKTSDIITDVRSFYMVPDGDQAPKHNLSEATVDELLGMLTNVCASSLIYNRDKR